MNERHNILIGAISGNYSVKNLENWVRTSDFQDVKRILFYYNPKGDEINTYCSNNNIELITPNFDMYGADVINFITNSGHLTIANSPLLVHHIRFLHWWYYLKELNPNDFVLLTDVNDIVFNRNPFEWLHTQNHTGIVASSEEVTHERETWNLQNYWTTFGIITEFNKHSKIYNAGSIAGTAGEVSNLCRDIYLLSINKPRNADQAAYNYLIQNSYKDKTLFTDMSDNWGVHLHVIKEGLVDFDLNNLADYTIIHQYDRFGDEILNYYTIPQ
jgi:hypothetical protein